MEKVLLPNGFEVFCQNRAELMHFYEDIFDKRIYVQRGIRLGDGACVFDVGANAGTFTLFVQTSWPGTEVYSFEPSPPTFEALSRNAARYAPRARLFNVGVSDASGSAQFTHYPKSTGMSSFHADEAEEREALQAVLLNEAQRGDEGARALLRHSEDYLAERLRSETYSCQLVTLSEMIRRFRVERVDLLKIDVQKCELEVLQGLDDEHWPRIGQVVVEVHDKDGRVAELCALLESHGFEVDGVQDELYRGSIMVNVYGIRPGWRVQPSRAARPPVRNRPNMAARAASQRRALGQAMAMRAARRKNVR
ncbi:MAG: FkbM family methyltransferase [Acidobacteriota bacterium]